MTVVSLGRGRRVFASGKGLRSRALGMLVMVVMICVVAAAVLGDRVINDIRLNLGSALARDSAIKAQQRTQARIGLEMALARRLADNGALIDWMRDEGDPAKFNRFQREADGFRRAFSGRSYYAVPQASYHTYMASDASPTPTVIGTTDPRTSRDAWYVDTTSQFDGFWVNISRGVNADGAKVWINAAVRDDHQVTRGAIRVGIELGRFLDEVLDAREVGVTTMILNEAGMIVAHPDRSLIAFGAVGRLDATKNLFRYLGARDDKLAFRALLAQSSANPNTAPSAVVTLDGRRQVVALTRMPDLRWIVVSAVDLKSGGLIKAGDITSVVLPAVAVLVLILVMASLNFDRMVLRPLVDLTASVRRIAAGDYQIRLSSKRLDELGELTRAFDDMAQRISAHSERLEGEVAQRTAELAETNARLVQSNRALTDSIAYASLIQRAILPDRLLADRMPGRHFVVWQPKAVVGGDFYLFYERDDEWLFGVVDCAGHGVPGACMTMIAHAAIEIALAEVAWNDPASLLLRLDRVMRQVLPAEGRHAPATSMDMGLAHFDSSARTLTFAGAKLDLYWAWDGQARHLPGGRRGINDRKSGDYVNATVSTEPGQVFYIATDGLLDQAGGPNGFGFGVSRFNAWLVANAEQAMEAQRASLVATLDAYRGGEAQRDDITVLAFRV